MYKLQNGFANQQNLIRILDDANIPFDPANTDYVQFKIDVANGNELQDSEGVVMSPEAAQAFIATLP